jgi:hypothetical protein
MKLQDYKDGKIVKIRQSYQFIVNGKIKGTYNSISELVENYNGKQESKQKRTRKRKSSKKVKEEVTEVPQEVKAEVTSE